MPPGPKEAASEAMSASGFSLVQSVRGWGFRNRSRAGAEILNLQFQQCGVDAARIGGPQRRLVLAERAGDILLGKIRVAAHLVIARRERRRHGHGQSLDRLIR